MSLRVRALTHVAISLSVAHDTSCSSPLNDMSFIARVAAPFGPTDLAAFIAREILTRRIVPNPLRSPDRVHPALHGLWVDVLTDDAAVLSMGAAVGRWPCA